MITIRRTGGIHVAALLAALLAIAGCRGEPKDTGATAELEIRAYTVPEGMDAEQLRDRLRGSLSTGGQDFGTILTYPDGSLVVTAPASVQAGVEALIERMKASGPSTMSEPKTVAIDYWLVVGRPDAAGTKSGEVEDRDLRELSTALEQIQEFQGPLAFRVLEKLRLTSASSGGPSRMTGRFAQVEQRVLLGPESSNELPWRRYAFADIRIDLPGHSIATRVKLDTDSKIVLGQTGLGPRAFPVLNAKDDENLMLFYVLSARY